MVKYIGNRRDNNNKINNNIIIYKNGIIMCD